MDDLADLCNRADAHPHYLRGRGAYDSCRFELALVALGAAVADGWPATVVAFWAGVCCGHAAAERSEGRPQNG